MKKMETIRRIKIIDVLKREDYGSEVNVKGWVRTRRGSKSVHFIALNDGSTINNVQVVADADKFDDELIKLITTGACLSVTGELVQSVGSGQAVEIQAREIEVLGTCGSDYPMQKKGQSMEYMRTHAHMRLRTNTFGAVFRIRHHMAMAIHRYFHEHGFFYFHTPIITGSDCEGAGAQIESDVKSAAGEAKAVAEKAQDNLKEIEETASGQTTVMSNDEISDFYGWGDNSDGPAAEPMYKWEEPKTFTKRYHAGPSVDELAQEIAKLRRELGLREAQMGGSNRRLASRARTNRPRIYR